jgi:hypothetical protein
MLHVQGVNRKAKAELVAGLFSRGLFPCRRFLPAQQSMCLTGC